MINDNLYELIQIVLKDNKILYVGDDAQLKPPKQTTLSKAFTAVDSISKLTQVMRTDSNTLLAESMYVREHGNFSKNTNYSNGQGVVFVQSLEKFLESAINAFRSDDFKNNPLLLRILSATNDEVVSINSKVRQGIYGDGVAQYEVGDIIMGYANWGTDYETKQNQLNNGGDYQIMKVSPVNSKIEGIPLQGFNITFQNLLNANQEPFTAFVLDKNLPKSVYQTLGEKFEELRLDAMRQPKGTQLSARAWLRLSEFGKFFITPIDITYNGLTKIPKTIDYGYAHTIHKSQGGTYKYSYVLGDTIPRFREKESLGRLRYVAVTRAENASIILLKDSLPTQHLSPIITKGQQTFKIDNNLQDRFNEIKSDQQENC